MRLRLLFGVFALGCVSSRESTETIDAGATATVRDVDATLAHVASTRHLRAIPRGAELLEAQPDGFANKAPLAGGLAVRLPRAADGEARLTLRGTAVSIKAEGVGGANGVLKGDAVVWSSAAPDTDLVQVVDGVTVEELRLLHAHTNRYVARWRIHADGLTLRAREGRLELVDAKNWVALGTAPIIAVDARGERRRAEVTVNGDHAEASFDLASAAFPVTIDPGWSAVPSMEDPRLVHTATTLADGRILVAAGGSIGSSKLSSAEIFDPTTNTWSTTGSLKTARDFHRAVLIGTKVLVAGGLASVSTSTAEIYDPATGTWSSAAPMNQDRFRFELVSLGTGKVLALGGAGTSTAEIYDPAANTWTPTGSMNVVRSNAAAVTLATNKVFVTGGHDGSSYVSSAEMFDGSTWTLKASFPQRRGVHTATLLPGNKVLIAGGSILAGDQSYTSTAEIYDVATDTWSATGSLSAPRGEHAAVALSASRILIAGGTTWDTTLSYWTNLSTAELYDVPTGKWLKAASMAKVREYHTLSPLPGGAALVVGGRPTVSGDPTASAERYVMPSPGDACTGLPSDACAPFFCADGVCCDKACTGTCESCLASKKGSGTDGTCGFVADGTDPDSECKPSCTGATQTNTVCSGTGTCRVKDTPSCATGYVCSGTTCATSCTSDTQCASTHYCKSNVCVAKVSNGTACTTKAECQSGQCVDGVCCDTACTGVCNACTFAKKGSGSDGTCGAIADGTDPDKECAASSCSGTTQTKAQVCGSSGGCRSDGTIDCAAGGYGCDAATGKCRTTCSNDGQCASTHWCSSGNCVAKSANGATCSGGNQCSSTFCADGVCCDKACTGGCEACTAALKGSGSDGTCGPVPADTDPKSACAADVGYPASCQADGMCDGSGACRVYAKDTTKCGATTCADGKVSGLTCNGAGACLTTAPKSCAPYACGGDACKTTCAGDADCSADAYCSAASTCVFKHANGDTCTTAKECTSAFCVDGVCCNTACSGQCEACDGASKGTCAPVIGDPHGARTACKGSDVCKGTCDGTVTSTCTYPSVSKDCGTTCADGKVTTKTCDGAGSCVAAAPSTCSGFTCADGAHCKTSCAIDGDCASGYRCVSNACVPATAKCSDDKTKSIDPAGAETPCGAYVCEQATGRCKEICTSSEDCSSGNTCDLATKQCVGAAAATEDSGGCATSRSPARGSAGIFAAIALGAVAIARGRRTRR